MSVALLFLFCHPVFLLCRSTIRRVLRPPVRSPSSRLLLIVLNECANQGPHGVHLLLAYWTLTVSAPPCWDSWLPIGVVPDQAPTRQYLRAVTVPDVADLPRRASCRVLLFRTSRNCTCVKRGTSSFFLFRFGLELVKTADPTHLWLAIPCVRHTRIMGAVPLCVLFLE